MQVNAQQNRFIYLQTENGQPFYVKVNNKVVSSSLSGYVILPKIVEGEIDVVVGFPKNEFPEENFRIPVGNDNKGYLIKNFGESGWSLFDMQSLALLNRSTPAPAVAAAVPVAPPKVQNDPFSTMLANVVKDSSILQNFTPVAVAKPQPDSQPKAVIQEPAVELPKETVITTPAIAPVINRVLSETDQDGTQLVYIDKSDAKVDTVRVFIPATNSSEVVAGAQPIQHANENPNPVNPNSDHQLTITPTIIEANKDTVTLVNDTIHIYKQQEAEKPKVENDDFSQPATPVETVITSPASNNSIKDKVIREDAIIVLPKAATSSKVNSDCRGFATDEDFLKLRKRMAAENNNDEMVNAARKIFRTKCFTTEQIKNLSFLFLTNAGKYSFFDAAYPHSSDSDQYSTLASQLNDPYYLTRFKAMIHK